MVDRMADKDKISALMDGELIDKALVNELSDDQEGLKVWSTYHLIGDIMRGDTVHGEWDIAGQVSLALEKEPVHRQFDSSENAEPLQVTTLLESQPLPVQAKWHLPAWLSQFGQVAIAACVSLVVILGVQQYSGSDAQTSGSEQQLPVLQTIPLAGSAEPVSLTRESVTRHDTNTNTNIQEQRRRINAMLQDYELQLRLNSETSNRSGGN